MFDEYFNPPTIAVFPVLVAAAPRAVDLTDSPVSTSINQDAPSTKSLKTLHFHNDPLHESLHKDSTSQGSSSNVRPIHTPFESLGRWTKDHPIANVIGDPSRSASSRKQLQTDAIHTYGGKNKLDEDLQGTPVDATLYRGMIGSLMYLTSGRPDLIYVVFLCAQYQAKPTEKHLYAVKRIFRYLKETINMGLWYSKDTNMYLIAYSDADHAGCQDTRRSTSRSAQFLGDKLISWSSKKQKSTVISKYQLADIFTKPLPRERFNFLIEKLGMRSMSPETLKRLTEEVDE
ncbi:hypothetical protein Tco_0479429 [Tanacetum coccineum]